MRRFVCGEAKRPAGLAMESLRRPTKSRQGAKPNSAKPTQVGSSPRRLSCIARQRLPIPSILSILSHSTPHPQPPHLYKCGGSHAANNEGPRTELHFCRDFALVCEDIRRVSAPALHPRLFRPARHQAHYRYSLKRSSSVTSDWTMPEYLFCSKPDAVTNVRCIAERVLVICLNAPIFVFSRSR